MTDLDRVQQMREQNWKPAVQYWKEQFDRSQAKIASLQAEVTRLKEIVDTKEPTL